MLRTYRAKSMPSLDRTCRSDISRGRIHNAFTATDPDGYVVTVNSSHVVGPV